MTTVSSCLGRLMLIGLIGQFAAHGWAQHYPVKVVRYLVPGSAGSGADVLARMIAGGLTQVFGQQVIVENRTGAGGNVGAQIAALAKIVTAFNLSAGY